jgi:two-component system sensor histidine kinase BarA
VIQNLVENAIKFTPQGSSVRIVARALAAGDGPTSGGVKHTADTEDDSGFALLAPARAFVEIRVIDTGIGIPDREKARVFDAFYQVDSSSTREYGGTGLGLSIVKRLIDAHDGKVRIEDNTPHGAVFVVTLPVDRSPSVNPSTPPPAPPP